MLFFLPHKKNTLKQSQLALIPEAQKNKVKKKQSLLADSSNWVHAAVGWGHNKATANTPDSVETPEI